MYYIPCEQCNLESQHWMYFAYKKRYTNRHTTKAYGKHFFLPHIHSSALHLLQRWWLLLRKAFKLLSEYWREERGNITLSLKRVTTCSTFLWMHEMWIEAFFIAYHAYSTIQCAMLWGKALCMSGKKFKLWHECHLCRYKNCYRSHYNSYSWILIIVWEM